MNYSLNCAPIRHIPPGSGLGKYRGKIGFNIFSASIVNREIKRQANELGLEKTQEYTKALSAALDDSGYSKKEKVLKLINNFSERLALCFYNMKIYYTDAETFEGAWEKETARQLLSCKKIIVGGGLAAGSFGKNLIAGTNRLLAQWGIDLQVERFIYPQYMPLLGCISLCPDGEAAVFDFGQTYSKGFLVKAQGETVYIKPLKKIESKWVKRKYLLRSQQKKEALLLNEYIQDYICSCLEKSLFSKNTDLTVVVSLAAYMDENGGLGKDGAYGKMEIYIPGYCEYLQKELRRKTGYHISMRMVGDQTAAALAVPVFPEASDMLIVTLGTAFAIQEPVGIAHVNRTEMVIE